MDAYGVIYYDAPGEADVLCAYLLKIDKVWACMSDDMDMFLYGCPRVMRNLSLLNHTVSLYDTNTILEELDMSENNFREIMVLSGTDYNTDSNTCLNETIKWFYEYKKYCLNCDKPYGFYVWLLKNTKYIADYKRLLNTYQIFQFSNNIELEIWNSVDFMEKQVDNEKLKLIMEKEGFVFAY
jgi:5'-3' exonuclease